TIWVLIIWVLPALGALAYALVGVNRVERRALRMRGGMVRHRTDAQFPPSDPGMHFVPLARLVSQMVERRLLPGNAIEPLVDGAIGFTGGMNVDCRYWKPEAPEQAYRDLHFRLRGPVVAQLMEVFADDWQFTTDEALRGAKWFAAHGSEGAILARAIEA